MRESIDWPRVVSSRPRRRLPLVLILVLLAIVIFGSRQALSYYVDALWFGSLGYVEVFWKTLRLQSTVFTVFAAATFVILYGSFLALKQAHRNDLPGGRTIFVGGQPLKLPVDSILRLIALGVSVVIAVATGAGMMAQWPAFALYWYAPRAGAGTLDPILGKPLHF